MFKFKKKKLKDKNDSILIWHKKEWFLVIILFLLIILFFIPTKNFNPSIEKDEKRILNIITTNGAIYDFVKNIGDDKISLLDLSFLFQKGHMHEVELLPKDIIKINSADVLFKIGYGIDDWIDNYLINNKKIKIYQLDKNVDLIKENNKINPHYWLSIKNAKIIVRNINEILNTLDPQNSYYYNKKTKDYLKKLDELENFAKDNLSLINNKVIITHPSFDYFFNDYNIKIVAKIYTDELKDLTPQEILNLSKLIKNENINVIFIEKGFSSDIVQEIANIYELAIFPLDPIEVIENQKGYYNLMMQNIEIIKRALK